MRANPFEDLEELLDRVSRQVEEGMGGSSGLGLPGSIPVDVLDVDGEFVVTADLPGYETDDVELTLSNQTLNLTATRESEEDIEANYVRRERPYGATSTRVRLPEPVEDGAVEATFADGVLTVTLPKESGDSKEIEIE